MHITLLHLENFRNYATLTLSPHPGINMILGQNGAGKTNLLEAIHYCALGRSHRVASDRTVIHYDTPAGACGVTLQTKIGREQVAVRLTPEAPRKKQVLLNRKPVPRLSDMMGRLQCVIFSPEDLGLVREGPAFRRRFLDMMLSQMVPGYFTALQAVNHALKQRNALLMTYKLTGRLDKGLITSLDDAMKEPSLLMMDARQKMVEQLNRYAGEIYLRLSGRKEETLAVSYTPSAHKDTYDHRKEESLEEDLRRKATTFGVHREDMDLLLSGRSLQGTASQGQVRTVVLTLKLAQLHLFKETSREFPVLLLDDVMSELDMTRRSALLEEISGVQTFVTCTDFSDIGERPDLRTYLVTIASGEGKVEEFHMGATLPESPREIFPWEVPDHP